MFFFLFAFFLCVFVYVYVCLCVCGVHTFVCVRAYICAGVWRQEVDIWCFHQSIFIYVFSKKYFKMFLLGLERGLSLSLELTGWLAGWPAIWLQKSSCFCTPWYSPPLAPGLQMWGTRCGAPGVRLHVWGSRSGVLPWVLNSGPWALYQLSYLPRPQ